MSSKLHSAVKRKYGDNGYVRENEEAPTKAEREEWLKLNEAARARIRVLEAQRTVLNYAHEQLYQAVDAFFSEPIQIETDAGIFNNLRNQYSRAKQARELFAEKKKLSDEIKARPCHRSRFMVGHLGLIRFCADTVEEALAKLKEQP